MDYVTTTGSISYVHIRQFEIRYRVEYFKLFCSSKLILPLKNDHRERLAGKVDRIKTLNFNASGGLENICESLDLEQNMSLVVSLALLSSDVF